MAIFSPSYTLGLIFILICGIIWAGASILTQYIYDDLNFQSPFLMTYLANAVLTIYLPLWQLWVKLGLVRDLPRQNYMNLSQTGSDDGSDEAGSQVSLTQVEQRRKTHTHAEAIYIAMLICPIWFMGNCLYNYSLFLTSVSSSTIISNLAGTFTFAFSWFLGLEELSYGKVLGIIVCFIGAISVGLQDSGEMDGDGEQRTLAGDIVALLSAVGYGLYTSIIRYKIPDDEGISMQLLLGYIGLINAITLSPVLIVLSLMGLANITQLTGAIFGFILLNGIFNTAVSDYLWARAVVLTSPTVATIGMSITIPLAMISDLFIMGVVPTYISVVGALLVVIGFILVNISKDHELMILSHFTYTEPVVRSISGVSSKIPTV